MPTAPRLPRHLSVDGVVDTVPAALLEGRGFRRKGRNFHRLRGPFVDSVFFQAFRGAPFSFCVNLSLILPFHHTVLRAADLPESPSADNATWLANTRIEFPTDEGGDHWLVVGPDRPAEVVAQVVVAHLPQALAFFDDFPSIDHVLAEIDAGSERVETPSGDHTLDRAVLLAFTDRLQEALALLAELPHRAVPEGLVDRLRQGASRDAGS
jgi:hypothetical protein